jgi:hypothetical protein
MPGTWYEIKGQPADQACLDRFADIMHSMDPRYGALSGQQIATWMDPNIGPYQNDPVQAFGWFVDGAGKDQPGKMQIALACRYERKSNRAHWMTMGWAAPNFGRGTLGTSSLTKGEIIDVLSEVMGQLVRWMNSLSPPNPTAGLTIAVRPHKIQSPFMHKLYEQGYYNAIADEAIGPYAVSINRQRTSIDSTFLEIKIVSAGN